MIYTHNIDPILITISQISLYWYGAMYAISFLVIDSLMRKNIPNINNQNITGTQTDKILFTCFIFLLLGGRLGYVIFYNFEYYLSDPIKILFIWQGGMSFHGAFIGIVIAAVRLKDQIKKNFLEITDLIVIYVPIGLFFGRVGNFINSELYGIPTNGSWGVVFPLVDELPRHPSMLYEAFLEGIIIFIILLILSKRKNLSHGIVTSSFLIFYSIFRFIVEFVRVPDMHIGYIWNDWLTMGQILTTPMMFIGLIILFTSERRQRA